MGDDKVVTIGGWPLLPVGGDGGGGGGGVLLDYSDQLLNRELIHRELIHRYQCLVRQKYRLSLINWSVKDTGSLSVSSISDAYCVSVWSVSDTCCVSVRSERDTSVWFVRDIV